MFRKSERTPRCAAADEEGDGGDSTRGAGYYEGMISSPLDARADEELDNITPNIKFVGIASIAIFGLCAAFVLANPPPTGSLVS